ncbi:MAG: ABC transporter permease [Phycisphaerales bacterium]
MQAALRFALRSLRGRPGRSATLAAAVALASALMVAVACGLATGQRAVEQQLEKLLGAVDARVVHTFGGVFEAALVDEVRRWPGVASAGGRLVGSLTLVRSDGAAGSSGRPLRATVQARGLDLGGTGPVNGLEMREGRRPAGPGEVAVDNATRKALRLHLGERVVVQRLGDPIELEVTGVFERPELGALQRPLVQLDRGTLAEAMGHGDEVTLVAIELEEGTDVRRWVEANASRVEAPLAVEPAEMAAAGFDRQVAGINLAFTAACMVGFLSCVFIVGTGLTTALAEQIRELALLRCVGAGRGHLVLGQLLTGMVVAGAGGVAGVPLGVGLTGLATWWWRASLPAGLAISWGGIALAITGALAAGMAGAAWPAFAAARVTPLQALRVRAAPPRRGGAWWFLGLGALLVAVPWIEISLVSERDARFWTYVTSGIPAVHVGWFLLSVPALILLSRCLGPPLGALLRLPRGLLTGTVAASPWRLGLTAGSLMVGVSILVSTWSNGRALFEDLTERVRFADGFAFKTSGFSEAEQARVRAMPEARSAVPIGYLPVRVMGQQVFGAEGMGPRNVTCVGFEPEEFFRLNRVDWIRGDPETALPALTSGEGVLVAGEFLTARGLTVGDHLTLGGPRTSHTFTIVGVVGSGGLDMVTQFFGIRGVYMEHAVSCVFMDFDAVARHFGTREALMMQFDLGPGATAETEELLGERLSNEVPGAVFSSGRAIKEKVAATSRVILGVCAGVAFAALVLAAFGVGNVVAAGISSRRFELGVLRACGATRGMVARLILGEAALVAVTAAVTGTCLGLQLAWHGVRMYHDMAGLELRLVLPWEAALAGWCVMLALTLGAASIPLVALLRQPTRALLAARGG